MRSAIFPVTFRGLTAAARLFAFVPSVCSQLDLSFLRKIAARSTRIPSRLADAAFHDTCLPFIAFVLRDQKICRFCPSCGEDGALLERACGLGGPQSERLISHTFKLESYDAQTSFVLHLCLYLP